MGPLQTVLDACTHSSFRDAPDVISSPDASPSPACAIGSPPCFSRSEAPLWRRFPSALHFQSHYSLAARNEPLQEFQAVTIKVVTGNLRGAGSESAAFIQLVGTDGSSPRIPLVDPSGEHPGFERGSTKSFDVSVPKNIGPIRRVYVEKEKGRCTEQGEGWYLQHVEVINASGENFIFQCNSWLGDSDCGDYQGEQRVLCTCHTIEAVSTSHTI